METIKLWPKGAIETADGFEPELDIYTLETDKAIGAIVICPGGAYTHRAPHEGRDIALRFNEYGYHAFVVQYRVAPNRFPAPQQDVFRAVKLVRANAEEWKVRPEQIAVCGFSAGGHLAACSGTLFNEISPVCNDDIDKFEQRPDALILSYPVISGSEYGHKGSFENLFGKDLSADKLEKYSLEKRITAETPPTFLWHTVEDAAVPMENSMLFASGLRKHGISVEMHIFPEGRHGLGMLEEVPALKVWPELCRTWLKDIGF
ncbi:MAG: alpha/beta hydrolase [Lentisphaerae bacterium]|nr:alpha/beta hydrolase [Lentisphaerota bacterium]MCP4100232.1 alpha/beta hydrolase [Lentisphaerota bacterium]